MPTPQWASRSSSTPKTSGFLSTGQFAVGFGRRGNTPPRAGLRPRFYMGYYYAEALILAEKRPAGRWQSRLQEPPLPRRFRFFLASCDYTIIGDEYYAASAYLSREPTLLGVLSGKDYGKLLIIGIVVLGVIGVTLAAVWPHLPGLPWLQGHFLKFSREEHSRPMHHGLLHAASVWLSAPRHGTPLLAFILGG